MIKPAPYRAWYEYGGLLGDVYMIDWDHGIVQIRTEADTTHTLGLSTVVLDGYTGASDWDGLPVYAGDILTVEGSRGYGVVTYLELQAVHRVALGNGKDTFYSPCLQSYRSGSYTKVGNIHQHKYLLEVAA